MVTEYSLFLYGIKFKYFPYILSSKSHSKLIENAQLVGEEL